MSGDGDSAVHYFDNCPADQVALLVYTGERPEVSEMIFDEAKKAEEVHQLMKS